MISVSFRMTEYLVIRTLTNQWSLGYALQRYAGCLIILEPLRRILKWGLRWRTFQCGEQWIRSHWGEQWTGTHCREHWPPLRKKFCFSHWESQWDCSKINISMRSWARTSLRIKNLIKNLIKYQDLGQDLIGILIEILNEDFFSLRISIRISMPSCLRSWFLMRFLMRFLIFDEVLDEVLDSQWGSCPRPHWDLNFGTISLWFSMRKKNSVRAGSHR